MVEVNGKALLSHALDNLVSLGIKKAVVVVGRYKNEIKRAYSDSYHGIELVYAVQKEPRGLVDAILSAQKALNDDFVLQLSDEIFFGLQHPAIPMEDGIEFIVGYVPEDCEERIKGNFSVEYDASDLLIRCVEKPKTVINNRKGTGFCIFKKDCLDILKDACSCTEDVPRDLCDFLNLLIRRGKTGLLVKIADREVNINRPEDLLLAEAQNNENV